MSVTGQTANIAAADKKIYGLRENGYGDYPVDRIKRYDKKSRPDVTLSVGCQLGPELS